MSKVSDGVQACFLGQSPVVMPRCNVMLKPDNSSQKRACVDPRHLHRGISEINCSEPGETRAANMGAGYAYVISNVGAFWSRYCQESSHPSLNLMD
jgi:hypothetical protein